MEKECWNIKKKKNRAGTLDKYIWLTKASTSQEVFAKTEGSPKNAVGVFVGRNAEFTNNGNIIINSEGGAGIVVAGGTIKNYGNIQVSGGALRERVESPLLAISLSDRKMPVKKNMRIYVDSLGEINPIEGLANLGLKGAELLIGAEATEKTNATEVTVGLETGNFNFSVKGGYDTKDKNAHVGVGIGASF